MNNAQLSAIATSLETKAGASTVANAGLEGYWKRIAAAAEVLAGATTTANPTLTGYMLRTAKALEVLSGTTGAEETNGYTGFLKRIVDALEVKAGAVGTTDIDSRAVTAAANAVFVADVTAPTLSSPTGTQTGSSTGTSTVTTNEANGTLYAFLSTSATAPTAANLKTGTGAVTYGSQTVTITGVQTVNWTGLTASTTYYTHWLHRDAAGNDSAIVSGAGFTTAAAAAITAPTLARTSAAAASPLTMSVSGDATMTIGMYIRLQISTDVGFTAPTDYVVFLDGASWELNDSTIAGFSTPAGTYWARARLETSPYDAPNNTTSAYSNVITDTINASVAAWTSTTGVSKYTSIVVSGGPPATTYNSSANNNSTTSVRMDRAASNDAWHVEFEVLGFNTGGTPNGNILFGVIEGPSSPDLSAILAGTPGQTTLNGFTVSIPASTTNFSLRRNGATSNIALPGGTVPAVGDRFIVEYKHSTKRIDTWYYRSGGAVTAMHSNVILTSFIPTSVYLFGTAYRIGDTARMRMAPADFVMTPTAGYTYYA